MAEIQNEVINEKIIKIETGILKTCALMDAGHKQPKGTTHKHKSIKIWYGTDSFFYLIAIQIAKQNHIYFKESSKLWEQSFEPIENVLSESDIRTILSGAKISSDNHKLLKGDSNHLLNEGNKAQLDEIRNVIKQDIKIINYQAIDEKPVSVPKLRYLSFDEENSFFEYCAKNNICSNNYQEIKKHLEIFFKEISLELHDDWCEKTIEELKGI